MKRRTFIKTSLAAGVAAALPGVAFMSEAANAEGENSKSGHLAAQMIWCAQSVPVPLIVNGPATQIASSSGQHPSVRIPDLHVIFAKEFLLDEVPPHALLRLFCYTRYRLYINGVYFGRGPGRFQNQRPEYDTREIAAGLRSGKNVIAVLVHRDAPTGRIMRHDPGFAAVMSIGPGPAAKSISTDATWLSRPDHSFGSRDEAWSSIEEHIDARKAVDFTDTGFSPEGWANSILVGGPDFRPVWPRTTPLQKETPRAWSGETARFPISLDTGRGVTLDLPEIIQAYHTLELEADEGSAIEVAYLLPEDEKSGKSTYIARGGRQRYMGGDTFAFNRLSIRLISGRATVTQADAVEVRYPFERAASFQCSDPFFNQLWTICARSLELLSEDSYVDCADRERVEWTDDSPPAFDCTRVMMRGPEANGKQYWGDNRLLGALLRRIALTQQEDGQIKAHSCSERWDIHAIMEDRSLDWVIQLRQYFDSSGDRNLVKELWPTLRRQMEWFLARRTERGLVEAREWEVWDNPLRYQICEGAGLNALFYKALCDAAFLAEEIGEGARSKEYSASAAKLRSDFNALLWNASEATYDGALFGPNSKTNEQLNGRMFPGPIVNGRYQPTAQAALFSLYCDIVPPERLESVRKWVQSHLDQVKGPMSHYYLFDALYRIRSQDRDRDVLERMRTGWKSQVESPWQTAWESLGDPGASKAHMYGIVPGYFLTAYVLGARRDGPVARRSILIEPRCSGLSSAQGIAVTEFGAVQMKWSREENGSMAIECVIPSNVSATVRLYRLGEKNEVSVDQKQLTVDGQGTSLEFVLKPGRHTIQYSS